MKKSPASNRTSRTTSNTNANPRRGGNAQQPANSSGRSTSNSSRQER